jgi:hypothetical protein
MSDSKKLSPTKKWEHDHPDDKPCPRNPSAAQAWRRTRGLLNDGRAIAERVKYEAAMIETRLLLEAGR